jgi:adenylate cyclase
VNERRPVAAVEKQVEPAAQVGTAAIVFTDLVGFTAYTDAHGDRAAVDVLDRQATIVEAGLAGRGRVVKELGDGLMLWFHSGSTGVEAARDILTSVATARDAIDFPLAVRMGMHFGEVVERGDDYIGQTVNIAARVADLAGPGELLVTEQVVRSLDGHRRRGAFRPVGPTRVKGVGAPIWLHRLDQDG